MEPALFVTLHVYLPVSARLTACRRNVQCGWRLFSSVGSTGRPSCNTHTADSITGQHRGAAQQHRGAAAQRGSTVGQHCSIQDQYPRADSGLHGLGDWGHSHAAQHVGVPVERTALRLVAPYEYRGQHLPAAYWRAVWWMGRELGFCCVISSGKLFILLVLQRS